MTQATSVDLAGRVFIVTGGGVGIGKVYSKRLAQAGACVVVADIQRDEAKKTVYPQLKKHEAVL